MDIPYQLLISKVGNFDCRANRCNWSWGRRPMHRQAPHSTGSPSDDVRDGFPGRRTLGLRERQWSKCGIQFLTHQLRSKGHRIPGFPNSGDSIALPVAHGDTCVPERVRRSVWSLRAHQVRFGSHVGGAGQSPDGTVGWTIGFASGFRSVKYDRIVIANGHQAMPVHPSFASSFSGEYLHSRDYRVPEKFAGKRVLVVGTGNSALDIAADVCSGAFATAIVARSPVLIMPRMIFGIPLARVLAKVEKPWLPWPVARRIRELLSTIVSGRMEKWGLVTPTIRTHPASIRR